MKIQSFYYHFHFVFKLFTLCKVHKSIFAWKSNVFFCFSYNRTYINFRFNHAVHDTIKFYKFTLQFHSNKPILTFHDYNCSPRFHSSILKNWQTIFSTAQIIYRHLKILAFLFSVSILYVARVFVRILFLPSMVLGIISTLHQPES